MLHYQFCDILLCYSASSDHHIKGLFSSHRIDTVQGGTNPLCKKLETSLHQPTIITTSDNIRDISLASPTLSLQTLMCKKGFQILSHCPFAPNPLCTNPVHLSHCIFATNHMWEKKPSYYTGANYQVFTTGNVLLQTLLT
jgi:hypothetical protein